MCLLLRLWRTGDLRSEPSAHLWPKHDVASWVRWGSPNSQKSLKSAAWWVENHLNQSKGILGPPR